MRRPLAVLAALLTLGGCYLGPDPVQYAALASVDGRPTAVVAACGRPSVSVDVFLNATSDDRVLRTWAVTVTVPDGAAFVEVERLGAERPGFDVTTVAHTVEDTGAGAFGVVPLETFEAGEPYTLDSSDSGPEGTTAPKVTFRTDDLSRIGAGQVLAPVDRERSRVISRESFLKNRCG
jgi:hypothetical protein